MQPTLADSRDRIIAICQGLTTEQANAKAAESDWSIHEILEHLAIAELGILIGIKRTLGTPAADAESLAETNGKTEIITTRVAEIVSKIVSPDRTVPTGRYGEWPTSLEAFLAARAKAIELESTVSHEFDCRHMPHPALGALTLRQWLYFNAAHAVRHSTQIENLLKAR